MILTLYVVLFLGLIVVIKTAERNGSDMLEQFYIILWLPRRNIIEGLVDICGEESKQFQNETTGYTGYKWKTENSMLQVSPDGTHVVISMGLRQNFATN